MGLKEDLLQTVREAPQDMTPRLALADYLQEHGATERQRAYGEYLVAGFASSSHYAARGCPV